MPSAASDTQLRSGGAAIGEGPPCRLEPERATAPGMRVAGLDFGQARIGLAVSDEMGVLAHPRPFLDGRDVSGILKKLAGLARDEGWQRVILGLPRNLDGSEGLSARRARRFASLVERATGLPVEFLDERLSTREAKARLTEQGLTAKEQRSRIDSASAAILLQSWLDRASPRGHEDLHDER